MNTATEYSEEKIMEVLQDGFDKVNGANTTILVSHAPPRGTRDRTFIGLRGGSKSIKSFIENNQVDLCLAGHIHEANGVEQLDTSIVANSGSFKRGRYLSIEIGDNINVSPGRIR